MHLEQFGRLDALVHDAGNVSFAALEDTTDEMWRSTIGVRAADDLAAHSAGKGARSSGF